MQATPYSFFVQWHLTERCNLRCRHCYQVGTVPEMSWAEIRQAMENIKGAIESWVTEWAMEMSPSFHFTGGEPVLREDLFDVLDHARYCGFSTALMSNGTLINADIARRIGESQVSDVQISLDGLEPIHDSIRGTGSFKHALHGIEHLISQGVATSINVTISRLNVAQIDGLVQLARAIGVNTVSLSRLVPCGSGRQFSEEMLTGEELRSLYGRMRQFQDTGKVAVISRDPLAMVANMDGEIPDTEFPVGGCAAGVFGVTIASDGSIMPCRRMDLSIGNIRKQSFRELWAESPVLWSLRERQHYHDGCESCRYWAVCRGCRAVALACSRASGEEDYLGPDPQCPLLQANSAS
jgi:radical SAM protein with 4Fe4S-binding SPASM domain